MSHASAIRSGCQAATAAKTATAANANHGIAGFTVRGITAIEIGCIAAAMATAIATVLIAAGRGVSRKCRTSDRMEAPKRDVRHDDRARPRHDHAIRAVTLAANADLTRSNSGVMGATP